MNKTILVPVVTGVLTLSIGFVGGSAYQKHKLPSAPSEFGQQRVSANGSRVAGNISNSTAARDGLMRSNAPVSGKIINVDSTSITVQTQDGSNKIVLISDQTKVNKTTETDKADLVVGAEVMVIGNTTNGAVSAQSISLGTNFMRSQTAPTPSITAK